MRVVRLVLESLLASLLAMGSSPLAAQSAADLFGKPVAPFTLAAEAVATPVLGVPVDVRVTLETRAELADIEVRISADDGLSLDVADYTLYAPAATPDQRAEWVISVVPVKEGAHRLLLFGEALVGGTRQGRSAVATLRVGDEEGESGAGQREQPASAEQRGGPESGRSGEAREGGRDARADSDSTVRAAAEPVAERVIRLPATVRP